MRKSQRIVGFDFNEELYTNNSPAHRGCHAHQSIIRSAVTSCEEIMQIDCSEELGKDGDWDEHWFENFHNVPSVSMNATLWAFPFLGHAYVMSDDKWKSSPLTTFWRM